MMSFRYIVPIALLFSCSAPEEDEVVPEVEEVFEQEVFIITDTMPPLDPAAVRIMEQLKICSTFDTMPDPSVEIDTTGFYPPCDARFFRVFQYLHGKDYSEGFMVEMVPGMYNTPVHQLVVIKANDGGGYRIVNQYLGMLMEMRTTESGINDLLMGYRDPDVGLVAIRHEWNGQKYDPVDVEEINDHFVKPEMKDSINAIFLPAFNAGH
jgi:hypothetical protein